MKLTTLLVTSSILALTAMSNAAVLADWTFTGYDALDHAEDATADGVVVADAATYVTTLAGVSSTDLVGFGTATFSNASASLDELNVRRINDGAGSLDFTISVSSGTFNLTELSVDLWRNGGGAPGTYLIEANADGAGFVQFGSNSVEANSGDSTFRTHTFTGDVSGSSIVVRLSGLGGVGNVHINDIQASGVTVVPEPSSSALLGLGGLALIMRRRK